MSFSFVLKRKAYLTIKRIIQAVPPLRNAYSKRTEERDRQTRESINDHGTHTLVEVTECLNSNGFMCFPMFGTLLGIVREGGFIAHDLDLDFGVIIPEHLSWESIESLMSEKGYSLDHQYSYNGSIVEEAFWADGFTFDLFKLSQVDNSERLRAYFFNTPDDVIFPEPGMRAVKYFEMPAVIKLRPAVAGSQTVSIPENAEEIVELLYGPNWRVPDPDWVSGSNWITIPDATGKKIVVRSEK